MSLRRSENGFWGDAQGLNDRIKRQWPLPGPIVAAIGEMFRHLRPEGSAPNNSPMGVQPHIECVGTVASDGRRY